MLRIFASLVMRAPLKHTLLNQTLWLSAGRAVFWEEEKALILADLHFGKTGHFRKEGIGIPQTIFKEDLQRLVTLIQFFKAGSLIVVGDMFHSKSNSEHDLFEKWRKDLPFLDVHLVKGNHDILKQQWYEDAGIQVHQQQLIIKDFCFLHDEEVKDASMREKFLFCGHLHPGITIRNSARQSLHFPCFHFASHCCTLPAFSKFTGVTNIRRKEEDKVFAIVEDSVMQM
ncbi:MAG: ligase-associated DNA damage response endonuclease PdeM [Agriterribacter sp.]